MELLLWPLIEVVAFAYVASCLWRWRRAEQRLRPLAEPNVEFSTYVLLGSVVLGSWTSMWYMGDPAPVYNWAALDVSAGALLYSLRSRRLSLDHPGLQHKHAAIIFIFAVMAATHLCWQAMTEAGFAPPRIWYGRTLMALTYLQLAAIWLAEREVAYDVGAVRRRPFLSPLASWLLVPVDYRPPGRARGDG